MQMAMGETQRRRERQVAYNTEHGIVPTTIVRPVTDVMDGSRAEASNDRGTRAGRAARKVAESEADYSSLRPDQLAARMKKLEQQMYQHARDLEFEAAAQLRDELQRVKARFVAS